MKALLCAMALMALPSVAHAAPFMPDQFRFDILGVTWDSSGTDTFCWQCADGDPSNDMTGTVNLAPGDSIIGEWWGGHIFAITTDFGGTATTFTGLYELFAIDVRLNLWDLRTPSEGAPGDWSPNPEYPLVSVTYGQLYGAVFGYPNGFAMSWGGEINGVYLDAESWPDFLDRLPITDFQPFNVSIGAQPAYTPEIAAVPEPTTLLLLGSGLIGAEWKRRRRQIGEVAHGPRSMMSSKPILGSADVCERVTPR